MDRRLFIMKKDRFWPFYQLSVFSGVGGFVKRKKDRFWPFYQISAFSGVGGFVKRKKRLFLAVLSDFGIFRCWRLRKT
jgi:hypothetical protein